MPKSFCYAATTCGVFFNDRPELNQELLQICSIPVVTTFDEIDSIIFPI